MNGNVHAGFASSGWGSSTVRKLTASASSDWNVLVLCNASKQEARQLKTAIAEWMQTHLGLPLNQEKTLITHWRQRVRFLGYDLQGRANRNGTKWLHLSVPKAAVREVVAKIKRATVYSQAPHYDVFTNVNAVTRGWTNYYRYAHNTTTIGGKLSQVIYFDNVKLT